MKVLKEKVLEVVESVGTSVSEKEAAKRQIEALFDVYGDGKKGARPWTPPELPAVTQQSNTQ